jgi:stage II sporulation protein M
LETTDRKVLTKSLVAAASLFAVAVSVGLAAPLDSVSGLMQELGELLRPLASVNPFLLFLVIFANNAVKALGVIVLGVLMGIPPVIFLGINGFILGSVISWVKESQGLAYTVAGTAPHGIIEIPMLLLGTALGFMVGLESIRWARRKQSMVKPKLAAAIRLYVKVILPGLAVAAVIEVLVTPCLLSLVGGR